MLLLYISCGETDREKLAIESFAFKEVFFIRIFPQFRAKSFLRLRLNKFAQRPCEPYRQCHRDVKQVSQAVYAVLDAVWLRLLPVPVDRRKEYP